MAFLFTTKKRVESADKEAARKATEAALKARSSRTPVSDNENPRISKNVRSETPGSTEHEKKQIKDESKRPYGAPNAFSSRMSKSVIIPAESPQHDSSQGLGRSDKVVLDERSTGTEETIDISDSESDQDHLDYGYDGISVQQHARTVHRRSSLGGSLHQRRMSAAGSGGLSRRPSISRRASMSGGPSSRHGSPPQNHRGSSHCRSECSDNSESDNAEQDYLSESMRSQLSASSSQHKKRSRVNKGPARSLSDLSASSHGRSSRRASAIGASSHRSSPSPSRRPSIKTSELDHGYGNNETSGSDSGKSSDSDTDYEYGENHEVRADRRTRSRRGSVRRGSSRTESTSSHEAGRRSRRPSVSGSSSRPRRPSIQTSELDYGYGDNDDSMDYGYGREEEHRAERRHSRRPSDTGGHARNVSPEEQRQSRRSTMSGNASESGSGRVHRRSSTGPTAERWLEKQKSSGKSMKKAPVETPRGVTRQTSLDQAMKSSLLGEDWSETEQDE